MVTWSCLGFLYELVPTSTSLAWSLAASSPSNTMCEVLFPVSLRELVFLGWWDVYFGHLCVQILHLQFCNFAFVPPILEYFIQCRGQLLNVNFCFLSARCIRWPGFVPIRFSCSYVIDIMWLGLVCCTRLIRTQITVCSASFHLLLL